MSNKVSTKIAQEVRASAVLTASYVGSTPIDVRECNQANVFVAFTKGSLTTAEIKFQYSNNYNPATGVGDWFDYPFSDTSNATTSTTERLVPLLSYVHQVSATFSATIAVPLRGRWFRAAVKGTGTMTNSLMAVTVLAGVV